VIRKLGSWGLLEACSPLSQAGFERKLALTHALAACRSLGVVATVLDHLNAPLWLIARHATPELRDEWLPGILDGSRIGAIAVAEASGGTDLIGALRCQLREENGTRILDGEKTHILNLPGADFVVALARSAERRDALGFTLVALPLSTPGIRVERLATRSLRTAAIGRIRFEGCGVEPQQIIGSLHKGFLCFQEALIEERLLGAVALLAVARQVLDETIAFSRSRSMYGATLSELQTVRHRLAELEARWSVASAFVEDACQRWLENPDRRSAQPMVPICKLIGSESAEAIVDECLQLFGARGYLEDSWLARAARDVPAGTLFAGTSEAMRQVIADRIA
jgi:alkylation response protein AidB-like acyl-CoA dehydrogenase